MEASEECVVCKQPKGTLPKAENRSKERKDTYICSPGQKEYVVISIANS